MPALNFWFKDVPGMTVVFVETRGPYQGTGESLRVLKKELDEKGIAQSGDPFCVFYDDPGQTPAEELRGEACIPVARGAVTGTGLKTKDLPATEAAETRHPGTPETFALTYGPFLEALMAQGLTLVGGAREYYHRVHDASGPGSGYLIQQPVSRVRTA